MSFDIKRIAELANLSLNKEEEQTVAKNMVEILQFVNTITSLDLAHREASISSYKLDTVLREDEIGNTLSSEELAINAPKLDNSSIIVPQVIQR